MAEAQSRVGQLPGGSAARAIWRSGKTYRYDPNRIVPPAFQLPSINQDECRRQKRRHSREVPQRCRSKRQSGPLMADQDFERRLKRRIPSSPRLPRMVLAAKKKRHRRAPEVWGYARRRHQNTTIPSGAFEIWGVPVPRGVAPPSSDTARGLDVQLGRRARGRIKQGAAYLTGEDPQAAWRPRSGGHPVDGKQSSRHQPRCPTMPGRLGAASIRRSSSPAQPPSKALPLGSAMLRGAMNRCRLRC